MDWREEYRNKLVPAEQAVKAVKSGDTVTIPIDTPAVALSRALIARKNEIGNVTVMLRQPQSEMGWFEELPAEAFKVMLETQVGDATRRLAEKKNDYVPFLTSLRFKESRDSNIRPLDVVFIVVSPPDEEGYCSLGLYLSHKRDYARAARIVLAEVNDDPSMMVRLARDTKIHVSEVAFFTKHEPAPKKVGVKKASEEGPGEVEKKVSAFVSSIIRDGDTLQFGPGGVLDALVPLGTFDNKNDLGIHSALITSGVINLVKKGIVNGKRKNVNPQKSVGGGFRRIVPADIPYIEGNDHFLVRDMSYVNDLRVIASHDNFVAINGILAIDLAGQIAADSLGTRMLGGAGGQIEFAMGAMLSKGGHSIVALRSTTSDGKTSRISPVLDPGTIVSIPRTFSDYVITEFGIASLFGKSQRERAEALINIAHPDFRAELQAQARKMY